VGKRLRLNLNMAPELPETILGDGPRIREMLGHLVSNAIKFTAQGSVELRASVHTPAQGGPQLMFAVRDTGVGIPSDKLEGIFDSFSQGDSGLSRAYPGLGLGLALTHRLVAVMGGRIQVTSEVGVGSTFTVILPWRHCGEPEPVFELSPPVAEDGPIVLAVEDNPVGLRVLRHVLHRRHFRVVCATNGREAIETAKAQQVDLILMDLQMPDMNGLEASAEIRKLPGYESVPILALTANYSDQTREQCLAAGMQAFLSKPVDAHELWSTVSRYLSATSQV
jgi:CheY-like chemotaxis protein